MRKSLNKASKGGTRPVLASLGTTFLPDEDPAAYQALVEELLQEFSPRTPHQSRLVLNLADIEWELERHRRLLATYLRTEFRDQANVASRSPSRYADTETYQAERKKPDLGAELLSEDPERRQAAESRLASLKLTRAELTASSYDIMIERVRWHEGRIGDLERRRRALLGDYHMLRDRQAAKRNIPDAEIVP